MKNQSGFNLLELMIVLVIIGIIATFALPAYQKNVIKGARGEGMTETLDVMRTQENYFADNFTYTADLTNLNYAATHITANGLYEITASTCGGDSKLTQCVLLTAKAVKGQATDGDLTLSSTGTRTHGSKNSWIK